MKYYKFNVRGGWHQSSYLVPFSDLDLENPDLGIETFCEAALAIDSPSGYMIDLGWYGEFKKRQLVGKVVIKGDWDAPIEEKVLKTFEEAVEWVKKWIKILEDFEDGKITEKEMIKKRSKLRRKGL